VYSQNEEEEIIVDYFRLRPGRKARFFCDIGAYTGEANSNTRKLYETGWRGTVVEPAAIPFCNLQNFYANDPNMRCINALLADRCGLFEFHECFGNQMGTTDAAHLEQWQASKEGYKFRKIWVSGISWEELLRVAPGPYQFISIDTEGTNSKVLLSCPPALLATCDMVCVEREPDLSPMLQFLEQHGFKQHALTSENLIAVKV
jgi:FkbM family methyltransferase